MLLYNKKDIISRILLKGRTKLIKYILFDLDGTLTNPKEGITKCVQHALRYFGIEKECDELVEFIGPPLKDQFMKFAGLNEEDAEKAVSVYRERFAPIGLFENEIYPGVLDMLKELKKQGKIIALATSKPTIFATKIVEKYGIAPYLDYLSGSELDGTNVEKSAVVRIAMEALGANPEETVLVVDRMHDAEGAKENGISCIGVSYGFAAEGELECAGVKIIIDAPSELPEILSAM